MKKFIFVVALLLAARPLFALDVTLIEDRVHSLVNLERAKHGLPPLKPFSKLASLARKHSAEMAKRGKLSHAFEGRNALVRIQADYPELFGLVGENVAYQFGASEEAIALALMRGWMNSPGHRKNILNRQYNFLGVGVVMQGSRFYATQFFAYLIAELKTKPPALLAPGSSVSLDFSFLGDFPKKEVVVWVMFPDAEKKFYIAKNRFYKGKGVFSPVWNGNAFSVSFRCDKGKGVYKVFIGRKNAMYPLGISFRVQ